MTESTLTLYYTQKPYYIAVCEHGYGAHDIPAVAIALAQTEVPLKAKPSQLLVYACTEFVGHMQFVTPKDFVRGAPVWPNGFKPKLVGLTTTHRLFRQTWRVA